jgi:signal transduction histidine kinase
MLETANKKAQTYFDFLAHDTANLISPIASYAELLQMDDRADERVKKYARSINEQTRKTASLIQNLRRLSTVEQVRPDKAPLMDIKMALAEAEDTIRHGYPKKRISVSSEMPEGETFSIGGEYVGAIITNVIDNASRFSKDDDVHIEKRMTLAEEEGRMFWRLEIADHGPGIDDETKVVFSTPIEKAERFCRGVACSLNFDASILLHFGGRLIIKDRVPGDHGQGARIVLLLPRADPSKAPDN